VETSTDLGDKSSGLTGSLPLLDGDTLTPLLDHRNNMPTLGLHGLDHDHDPRAAPDNNPGNSHYDYNNNKLKTSGSHDNHYNQNEPENNWHRSTSDDCFMTELDELMAASATTQSVASLELDGLSASDGNKPPPKGVGESTLATPDNHTEVLSQQQQQQNKQANFDIGIGRATLTSESLNVTLALSAKGTLDEVESTKPVSTVTVARVNSSISHNTSTNNNNTNIIDETSTTNDITNHVRISSCNDESAKVYADLTSSLLDQDKQKNNITHVVPSSVATEISSSLYPTTAETNTTASNSNKNSHTSLKKKSMSESPAPFLVNASGSIDTPPIPGRANSPSPDPIISVTPKDVTNSIKITDKCIATNTNHICVLPAAGKDNTQSGKKDSHKEVSTVTEDNVQTSRKNVTNTASEPVVSPVTVLLEHSTDLSKYEAGSVNFGLSASIESNETPAPIIDKLTVSSTTTSVVLTTPESNTRTNGFLNQPISNDLNPANNISSQKEPTSPRQNHESVLSSEPLEVGPNDKNVTGIAPNHNKINRLQINGNETRFGGQDDSIALADIAAAAMELSHSLTGGANNNLTDSAVAATTPIVSVTPAELEVFDIKKLIIQRLYGQSVESDSEIEKVLSGTTDNDVNKHIVNTTNIHDISDATNRRTTIHYSQKQYFRIPHLSVASGKKLWLTAEYQVLGQDHAGYMYVQRGKNDIYRFLWDLTGHKRDVWAPISTRGWVRDEIALLKKVDAVLATPASITSTGVVIAGMKLIHNYPESGNNNENIEDALFSDDYSSLSSLSTSDASLDRLIDEFVGDHGSADRCSDHNGSFFESSNLTNEPEKDSAGDGIANLMVYISTSDSSEEDKNRSMMLIDRVKRSKRKRRSLQSVFNQDTFNEDADSHSDMRASHTQSVESESEYEEPIFDSHDNENGVDPGSNNSSLNKVGRLRTGHWSHGKVTNDDSDEESCYESSDAPAARKRPTLRPLTTKSIDRTISSLALPQSQIPRKLATGNAYVFTTRSGRQNRLPSRFLNGISKEETNMLLPLKSKKKRKAKKIAKNNSKSSKATTAATTTAVKNRKRTLTQQNSHATKKLWPIPGDGAMGTNANTYGISNTPPLAQDGQNIQVSKTTSIDSSSAVTSVKPSQKPKTKSRTKINSNTSTASPALTSSSPFSTISEEDAQTQKGKETAALVAPTSGPAMSARARRQQLRKGFVFDDSPVVVDISSDED
jgi:hypothetical protein